MIELLTKINHKHTHFCALAERNVLKILEGDCETAVGVHAKINYNEIELDAELFSLDGTKRYNEKKIGTLESAEKLGQEVGINLKKKSNNLYKK